MSDCELTSYAELAGVVSSIGMLARETRRARGLSGRQAAAQMGLNFSTLYRIEQGAGFNSDALLPILQWLDQTTTTEGATP